MSDHARAIVRLRRRYRAKVRAYLSGTFTGKAGEAVDALLRSRPIVRVIDAAWRDYTTVEDAAHRVLNVQMDKLLREAGL